MATKLVAAFLTAALVIAPGFAMAQDETLESLLIEIASTAAQHAAIARYYVARAEEARREMRSHEGMARAYAEQYPGRLQRTRDHCLRIAENYADIAEEYEQLAQLHKEESGTLE